MTPQERQLIDDLFDRLAKLETAPRDPEAMSAIMQGLRTAPNAVYALVQTALVQDEALKRANDRIQELEGGARRRTDRNRRFPRFDARRDLRTGPAARSRRLGAACPRARHRRRPPGMEQRPGDAAGPGAGTRHMASSSMASRRLRSALWRAAAGVRRRWRLVPRNRGGGRGRRGRRIAAARQHPLDDGRRRQPPGLRRFIRLGSASGNQKPWSDQSAAIWRVTPGSTTSVLLRVRPSGQRADDDGYGSRAGLFDQASNDDDDAITTPTALTTMAATMTATAITPEQRQA